MEIQVRCHAWTIQSSGSRRRGVDAWKSAKHSGQVCVYQEQLCVHRAPELTCPASLV